ncbi:MAG: molybdenum cofactor guanylyltransferase MobA [Aquabacterium sp.]
MAERLTDCAGWLLAGGEGRRVGGQDKGLLPWHGQPMAQHILARMAPQVGALGIVANRNGTAYQGLLSEATSAQPDCRSLGVHADLSTLPRFSGPLGGMITAMQASPTPWVWFLPCDMPQLPSDMLATLWREAHRVGADIAVPSTADRVDSVRHHWVCALMNQRVMTTLQQAFDSGERKVGHLIARCNWTSVSFDDAAGFVNLNTLET